MTTQNKLSMLLFKKPICPMCFTLLECLEKLPYENSVKLAAGR